jgi:Na+/phosphate symporter
MLCFLGAVFSGNRYTQQTLVGLCCSLVFLGLVLVGVALLAESIRPTRESKKAAVSEFMGGPSARMREGDSPRRVSGGLAHQYRKEQP